MKRTVRRPLQAVRRGAERGVVLFIALIMLAAMMLTGLALSHSVTTGVLVAGNLAFQQSATSAGDAGLEAARTWLFAQDGDLLRSDAVPGYIANWQTTFNPSTFNWGTQSTTVGTDTAGNTVQYVIHRMCSTSGLSANSPSQQCVVLLQSGASGSKGGGSYGSVPLTGTTSVYYRVTVRISGPRNATSYVQMVMY